MNYYKNSFYKKCSTYSIVKIKGKTNEKKILRHLRCLKKSISCPKTPGEKPKPSQSGCLCEGGPKTDITKLMNTRKEGVKRKKVQTSVEEIKLANKPNGHQFAYPGKVSE